MKTSYSFLLFTFVLASLSLSSCASLRVGKLLDTYENRISTIAKGGESPEQKFDALAGTLVDVMEETIRIGKIRPGVKFIKGFSEENKPTIEKIITDLSVWQKNMSIAEKALFWGKVAFKPYTRKLVLLVPKFEKTVQQKLETFSILSNIFRIVSPLK